MIEVYRAEGYCVQKPFRLKLDGELVVNKKGEPKRFNTMIEAFSYGQRSLEKKYGRHGR